MAQIVTDRFPEDQTPAQQRSERGADSVMPIRRDDFDRDVWCLLGLPVDIADVQSAVSEIEGAARDNRRLSFVTPNVNWLVRALKDKEARRQVIDSRSQPC